MAVKRGLSGGDTLLQRLQGYLKKVDSPAVVKVGFLEGATYPDGTSVALVAALNEFGVPSHNQPPRPFMRNMIKKESGHWGDDVGALLAANGGDAKKTLEVMGVMLADELRQSIIDTNEPALSKVTIQLRLDRYADKKRPAQSTIEKPLIDTGHMINSIAYEVVIDE